PSRLSAARAHTGGKMFVDARGHKKLCIFRPAVEVLSEADLLLTERLAVRRSSVLSMRRSVANVAIQHAERGAILGLAKDAEGGRATREAVGGADAQHVPAVSQKARLDVLGKGETRFPLDGDVVVVVDPAEVIEAQVTGQ